MLPRRRKMFTGSRGKVITDGFNSTDIIDAGPVMQRTRASQRRRTMLATGDHVAVRREARDSPRWDGGSMSIERRKRDPHELSRCAWRYGRAAVVISLRLSSFTSHQVWQQTVGEQRTPGVVTSPDKGVAVYQHDDGSAASHAASHRPHLRPSHSTLPVMECVNSADRSRPLFIYRLSVPVMSFEAPRTSGLIDLRDAAPMKDGRGRAIGFRRAGQHHDEAVSENRLRWRPQTSAVVGTGASASNMPVIRSADIWPSSSPRAGRPERSANMSCRSEEVSTSRRHHRGAVSRSTRLEDRWSRSNARTRTAANSTHTSPMTSRRARMFSRSSPNRSPRRGEYRRPSEQIALAAGELSPGTQVATCRDGAIVVPFAETSSVVAESHKNELIPARSSARVTASPGARDNALKGKCVNEMVEWRTSAGVPRCENCPRRRRGYHSGVGSR